MKTISEKHLSTLKELLAVEHSAIALKLGFISQSYNVIDESLLVKSIGLLDELSRRDDERSRKIVITVSAVLWTYKEESWSGLGEYIVLILNRIGFPPSSIMIDEGFNLVNAKFSGLGSLINELSIALHQLQHEIFIGEKKFIVTDFQKKVWSKMNEVNLLGISAPTSAGKSFIILLKSIELIQDRGGNIIYIVPTLSLVAQVASDYHEKLKEFGLTNYRIKTSYNSNYQGDNQIFILTQERALAAFSQKKVPFENIRILVVDEIQNIERAAFEGDQRAKTLYDTLIEFRHNCQADLTVISGPRVDGLIELGEEIFDSKIIDEERTKSSPVASFTYSVSKSGKRYYFNQFTDILSEPNRIKIVDDSSIKGYGKAMYQNDFLEYLSNFLASLGSDSINLIFSPTSGQARKTARKLSDLIPETKHSPQLSSLISYLKESVHSDYEMCYAIEKGFVYHHGKVPSHVRAVIEKAIKAKLLNNIVCTTTLLQGVNLPAQNVIVRNPDLAIKSIGGTKPKLTDYEIANLRGRAGRLLKDFIGRTFVLEEKAFHTGDDQLDLFPEAEKKLKAGYGEKYVTHRDEVLSSIQNSIPPSLANNDYAFLATYIRQTVLKYGDLAVDRLNTVGIALNRQELNLIKEKVETLEVPREICSLNRYWDPVDLDLLYNMRNEFSLPTSVASDNIEFELATALSLMNRHFPFYYDKYFGVNENILFSACISAKEWLKEKPLKQILDSNYLNNSDKIENRISLLQNKISYGLPMLLKPIYDILAPKNMFLRFIEIGAYMPVTRKMIEMNIPRETAIYLNNNKLITADSQEENIFEDQILESLRQASTHLDFWHKAQIESLI